MSASSNKRKSPSDGDNDGKDQGAKITFKMAMENLLTDESMTDVKVVSIDGKHHVPAVRSLLASRSKVFKSLLFGNYKESTTNEVQTEYTEDVLKAVVEFIYTDDAKIFHKEYNWDSKSSAKDVPDNDIDTLVGIVAASHYYGLPELEEKTKVYCSSLLRHNFWEIASKKSYHFFIKLIALCDSHGPSLNDLKKVAFQAIDKFSSNEHIPVIFGNASICSLSYADIDTMLQLPKFRRDVSDVNKFILIDIWNKNEYNSPSTPTKYQAKDCHGSQNVDRMNQAVELMRCHVELVLIPAIDLSTKVASSGLCAPEQLSNAYKEQAIWSQRNEYFRDIWDSCENRVANGGYETCLRCKGMKSGVHRWGIRVRVIPDDCELTIGIASINQTLNYSSYGNFFPDAITSDTEDVPHIDDLPRLQKNSVIKFELNMSVGAGTLHASVDGGEPIELCNTLSSILKSEDDSFVPIANNNNKCSVLFLGFE